MVSTDVQRAVAQEQTPSDQQIERWIEAALATVQTDRAALTIRFVGESEMSSLNQQTIKEKPKRRIARILLSMVFCICRVTTTPTSVRHKKWSRWR